MPKSNITPNPLTAPVPKIYKTIATIAVVILASSMVDKVLSNPLLIIDKDLLSLFK